MAGNRISIEAVLAFVSIMLSGSGQSSGEQTVSYPAPGQAIYKTDKAEVRVTITSSIYLYEVTNTHDSPIIDFNTGQYHCYSFEIPDGWEREITPETFHAWTNKAVIIPGRKANFSQRVTSRGAVLGKSDLALQFRSGDKVVLKEVWAPVAEPVGYAWFVAGVMLLIIVIHTGITMRRKKAGPSEHIIAG